MLARHFPPIGGAGVHRSLGYVRHLPRYGYHPAVVTGPGRSVDRWSPQDPALLASLPADAEMHRLPDREPPAHSGWRAHADRWLQRPQPWVRWWLDGAFRRGLEVAGQADLVLASCIPYDTAEAGARLSGALGIPWVADLEDPWALDEMRVQPTAVHQRIDFARMRRALASAAAIITCAPEAAERFRRAMPEHAHKVVAGVPIGFERESFRTRTAPPRAPGAPLRIVHTGSLHTELGEAHRRSMPVRRLLGGTSLDVDILTRSAVFLLEGIQQLIDADPSLADRVELHLAGVLTSGDRAAAERYPFVRLHGQLPHPATVALMHSADLLFLPMHDLPPGKRAGLIPYKTYEYLAARRPILAAVPDGDVRDLLERLGHATLCRPSDAAGMGRAVLDHLGRDHAPDIAVDFDSPPLRDLDRRRLVGRLAGILDDVLARTTESRSAAAA